MIKYNTNVKKEREKKKKQTWSLGPKTLKEDEEQS